ncbi:MAG: septum formation initiator family protein [Clostridia bacterium]|nr:septum formation initiator family protein [Clostridia bacterium]
MDFKKKQKRDASFKDFLLKIGLAIISIIFVVLVVADIKIYKKRKSLQLEVAKYQQQIDQLREKNQNLEDKIKNSDNSDYIEKIAREEQGMQRPGEKVVSFITPESKKEQKQDENVWDAKNWPGIFVNFWKWVTGAI